MQCRNVLTRIDAFRTRELAPMGKPAGERHRRACRSCDESQADVDHLAHAVKSLTLVPPVSCREGCKEAVVDSFDRVDNVWVAFANGRIRMIAEADSIDDVRQKYAKKYGRVLEPATIPATLRRQVLAAVHGEGVES